MNKFKLRYLPLLVVLALITMAASECGGSANSQDTDATNAQLQQYNNAGLKVHYYTYSWERWELLIITDFRATKLENTWSIWVGDGTGEPIDMCPSKGYPIPYSTEVTNPQMIDWNGGSGYGVVSQMDPFGTYPSQSTAATWILCVEPDGSLQLQYSEPQVLAYAHPVAIVFDGQRGMYRIVRVGEANPTTAVTLPTDVVPQILTDPSQLPNATLP